MLCTELCNISAFNFVKCHLRFHYFLLASSTRPPASGVLVGVVVYMKQADACLPDVQCGAATAAAAAPAM